MFLVEKQNDINMSRWCLIEKLREHLPQTVVVEAGDPLGNVFVSGYFCRLPRDGMRYDWGLASIYKALQLQLCSKEPSKWAYQVRYSG